MVVMLHELLDRGLFDMRKNGDMTCVKHGRSNRINPGRFKIDIAEAFTSSNISSAQPTA